MKHKSTLLDHYHAFQLASALAISSDIFINSDNDLYYAAQDSGLTVWNPADGKFIETF
jgi:hypothetical protein